MELRFTAWFLCDFKTIITIIIINVIVMYAYVMHVGTCATCVWSSGDNFVELSPQIHYVAESGVDLLVLLPLGLKDGATLPCFVWCYGLNPGLHVC